MAAAKKAPAKKTLARRKPAVKAAPTKRVVRRKPVPSPIAEDEPKVGFAPEAATAEQASETLKQDTLTEKLNEAGITGSVGMDEEVLFKTDIIDLRGVGVAGRFAIVLKLEGAGYIFDEFSEKDATNVYSMYLGNGTTALQLQHRNKLIKVVNLDEAEKHLLICAPVATSIEVDVIMTTPRPAAPDELQLGSTLYRKVSD